MASVMYNYESNDINEPAPSNKILNTRWQNVAYHTVSPGFPPVKGTFWGISK